MKKQVGFNVWLWIYLINKIAVIIQIIDWKIIWNDDDIIFEIVTVNTFKFNFIWKILMYNYVNPIDFIYLIQFGIFLNLFILKFISFQIL